MDRLSARRSIKGQQGGGRGRGWESPRRVGTLTDKHRVPIAAQKTCGVGNSQILLVVVLSLGEGGKHVYEQG